MTPTETRIAAEKTDDFADALLHLIFEPARQCPQDTINCLIGAITFSIAMDPDKRFDSPDGVAEVSEEIARAIRRLLPAYRALYCKLRTPETVQ